MFAATFAVGALGFITISLQIQDLRDQVCELRRELREGFGAIRSEMRESSP